MIEKGVEQFFGSIRKKIIVSDRRDFAEKRCDSADFAEKRCDCAEKRCYCAWLWTVQCFVKATVLVLW
jgi:hypothetical protein